MTLLSGSAVDCMRDYSSRFPLAEGTKLLADFCGVTSATTLSWSQKINLPNGDRLIKMICLFNQIGYKVTEFERLPKETQRLAQLIGYEVVPIQQVANALQYSDLKGIYDIVLRGTGMVRNRHYKLMKLIKEYEELRVQTIATWQERIDKELKLTSVVATVHRKPDQSSLPSSGEDAIKLELPTLALLLINNLHSTHLLLEQLSIIHTANDDVIQKMIVEAVGYDRLDSIIQQLDKLASS